MEQVLPGEDPGNPDTDPIIESNELKDAGDIAGARRLLMAVLAVDLRCLDAHAHLGNLLFEASPGDALRHYEVGVRIGELSLGEASDGVLPWGLVNNRPFLRCLNGYGLCLWRLRRLDEAAHVFDRMLWLNPSDHQGVRGLLPAVRAGEHWQDHWQDGSRRG
jgi:tetratricopeptide (TPR) repeat protein